MKKNFPSAFKQDDDEVVKYSELPEDQQDAARKYKKKGKNGGNIAPPGVTGK